MKLSDEAKKMIEKKNFASIATAMPDGSPQVSVVWVDHDGDTILVNTAEGRLKHKNLARNPKVALCIYDTEDPYSEIVIRGRVKEMTRYGADEHIDKMAKKYKGLNKYADRRPGEKRVLIKIDPTHVTRWK